MLLKLSTAVPRMPDDKIPAFTPKEGVVCAKLKLEISTATISKILFFICKLEAGFTAVLYMRNKKRKKD